MILILMVAAVVSAVVARQPQTPVAILVVVLLNAIIGFVQESKAESALEALRRMSTTTTTVRRDGRIVRLDADEFMIITCPEERCAVPTTRSTWQGLEAAPTLAPSRARRSSAGVRPLRSGTA